MSPTLYNSGPNALYYIISLYYYHQGYKIVQFATINTERLYTVMISILFGSVRVEKSVKSNLENFAKFGKLKGAAGGFLLLISCCRVVYRGGM
jgi:hypothetical protein